MSNLTTTFIRKTFFIEAVRVTDENIDEVASWCKGEILHTKNPATDKEEPYIKVHVLRAINDRQCKAFAGDWVLFAGTGFKVYTNKAFHSCFEAATKNNGSELESAIVPGTEIRPLQLTYGAR